MEPIDVLAHGLAPELQADQLTDEPMDRTSPDRTDRTMARILDAAADEARAVGLAAVTVDGVARRAGVHRVTVHRRTGGRDALLAALAAREGRRTAAALASAVADQPDHAGRLVEGFVAAVEIARNHPLVSHAAAHEPAQLIAAGMADDAALLTIGTQVVASIIDAAQRDRGVERVDAQLAGEVTARLLASIVLLPGGQLGQADDDALRSFARSTLVPMLLGGAA